jgi:hypothetical protein
VTRIAVAVLLLLATGAQLAAARPEPGARRSRKGFDLFAGSFQYFLVNRVVCGINTLGEFCVDPTNSPSIAGGFWPRGTPNQYIFNSGLQLAGVIPADAGFEWAGDTVGALFFDPKGTEQHGDAVTQLYSSLDAADATAWPNGGVVRDTAIYAPLLIGRNVVSQQDIWGRAWDGNPTLVAGRGHPMGVLVETRAMAWAFPAGNEDILYFVFNFYNITASDPAVYSNLDPAIQQEIAEIGADYQAGVQQILGVDLPDGGYTITNAYAAFGMDPDVDDAGHNFSTAVLPFSLAVAYKHDFLSATGFAYPPEVHGAPFAAAPGFVGVKYLKSPADPVTGEEFGLTMFSNTRNASDGFPDPEGVVQLWRYLSGNVDPAAGDNPCTVLNPIASRLCFLDQIDVDTRFYQSSGPFTLLPGQVGTIVVAYLHAAPLAAEIQIGTSMKPLIPPSAEDLASGAATARAIDRATGWVSHSDANGDGKIDQYEVQTVPRSLLQKSLVAQEVYDKRFLLPSPPDPTRFFLVPGNNQVTVVWEPSPTETLGDPFFQIAGDPTSALFDPNFREFDVEGYRIYRGRTPGDLRLIAEFDYGTTYFRDYTGAIHAGGNCAPELGIFDDCLEAFNYPVSNAGPYHDFDIAGDLIQVPPGGRVELADGSVFVVAADTAGRTGVTTPISLTSGGVPFAFVDRSVLNSITYFYAVTVFDVNSVKSGPSTLESAKIPQSAVPRGAGPGQYAAGELFEQKLFGADGTELDPTAPLPTIDPVTGIFSGPMPPTDGINVGLAAFVSELLPAEGGSVTVTIDSIKPGYASGLGNGVTERPITYYLTGQGSGAPVQFTLSVQQEAFDAEESGSANFPATNVDPDRAALYGGAASAFLAGAVGVTVPGDYQLATYSRAAANQAPEGASEHSQPRWWAGSDNENTEKPTSGVCTPWSGSCGSASAPVPDITLSAGRLPGIDTLMHISGYGTVASTPARDYDALLAGMVRAADFKVYWGAGGTVDSVIDVTHHVPVPFQTTIGPSWGILNASGFAATNQALTNDLRNDVLTWGDYLCVGPGPAYLQGYSGRNCGAAAQTPAVLSRTAELSLIAPRSSANSNAGLQALANSVVSTTGFMFYLNGHFFLMATAALPAAGTVWNARFFAGNITGPAVGTEYGFIAATRPPAVPGLRIVVEYTGAQIDYASTADSLLELIHTVPDPYYVTNNMELTTNRKVLKFVNLPAQAIIRIYSLSGILVDVVEHFDPTGGGEATWNLRNRNDQFVASGVYFYHVETPDGKKRVGRFTVVNFAQ